MDQQDKKLPPLPELGVFSDGGVSQELADRVLKFVYVNRPDIFRRVAESELSVESNPELADDEAMCVAFEKLRDEFEDCLRAMENVPDDLVVWSDLFFELRRRTRVMHGLAI